MPPRSAGKRKDGATTANQHNPKHENGLVVPGKRVHKQRSNGHLGACPSSNKLDPSRVANLPATPPPSNGHAKAGTDASTTARMALNPNRRTSVGTYSDESSESYSHALQPSTSQETHRQIDVNATKNPAVHRDTNALQIAMTVLKSCPLCDTIAILIVLLQIPPTFVSIIHILFTTLTFVPPSVTANSGISFADIFEGRMSAPSFGVIAFIDAVVLLVWLFCCPSIQHFAVDCAQTVIALTLGGGTCGREACTKSMAVCFSSVVALHLARSGIKPPSLRMLLGSTRGVLSSDPDDPLEYTSEAVSTDESPSWWRSILAIHILMQYIVRCIRDWYVRRERCDSLPSTMGDPEAANSQIEPARSESRAGLSQASDGDSQVSNNTDKSLSTKKKRKQNAQVRTQQPLWAALASTKIVMMKEYEMSNAASESAGTNATDVNNLGNAPFATEPEKIWITYIGSDEIGFHASDFPRHQQQSSSENGNVQDAPGVDTSKPFFVRVNGTTWQPSRINAVSKAEIDMPIEARWTGEIFGLAPLSDYECEFVSTIDRSVVFSTKVRTAHAPLAEVASSAALPPGLQRNLRPGSPTSTLKTAIATSETKLTDERNRQKRERKDQKSKLTATRKEITSLTNLIASVGSKDDSNRQKVQQYKLQTKQAEDAVANFTAELEALENSPEDEGVAYKAAKRNFQAQKDSHESCRSEFSATKQSLEGDVQKAENELTAIQQKKDRMQSRISKLSSERDRLIKAKAQSQEEAERKERELKAKRGERAQSIRNYSIQFEGLKAHLSQSQQSAKSIRDQISFAQQQALAYSSPSVPFVAPHNPYDMSVPDTTIPSAYPWPNHPAYGIPSLPVPYGSSALPMAVPLSQQAQQTPGQRTRGRTSSMLSDVSGFTQSSNEDTAPSAQPPPSTQLAKMPAEKQSQESNGCSGVGTSNHSMPRSPEQPNSGTAKGRGSPVG